MVAMVESNVLVQVICSDFSCLIFEVEPRAPTDVVFYIYMQSPYWKWLRDDPLVNKQAAFQFHTGNPKHFIEYSAELHNSLLRYIRTLRVYAYERDMRREETKAEHVKRSRTGSS